MSFRLSALLGAVLMAIITACAPATTGSNSPTQPSPVSRSVISIADDKARVVELDRPAMKIVSLAPSNTELLFAIGAGEKVVGVDDYSNYPEAANKLEKVGGYAKTNIEKVVSLAPDLVVATNIHVKTVVPEIERRGIPVVVVQPKTIKATLDSLTMVGKLTGKDREAADLVKNLQQRLTAMEEKVKLATARPRVYFELSSELFTVGPASFVGDMIVRAGGDNIAADAKTEWPQLNGEALILKDPEVIVLSDYGQADLPEQVKARPGWQVVSAVKAGRIFSMNADLLNRPGPRVFDGQEQLTRTLHPELFR